MAQEIADVGDELPPKKRQHQLLQLHSGFPSRAQEESRPLCGPAAPEVLQHSGPVGPSGSFLRFPAPPEEEPAGKGPTWHQRAARIPEEPLPDT